MENNNEHKSSEEPEVVSVLVVDDEKVIRDLFKRVLEVKGYSVTTVESGDQAVETIKKGFFDVIFLDIVMPGMDGVETLQAIREISKQKPVIVMTGFAVEEEVKNAFKLGAQDCLSKPFEIEEIIKAIEEALKGSKDTRLGLDKSEG